MFFSTSFFMIALSLSEAFIYVGAVLSLFALGSAFRLRAIQPIADLSSDPIVLGTSSSGWQLTVRAEPPLHHSLPSRRVLPQGGHRPDHGQFDIWQTRSSMGRWWVFLVMLRS